MPLLLALLFAAAIGIAGGQSCTGFASRDYMLFHVGEGSFQCDDNRGPGCHSIVAAEHWTSGTSHDCNIYCGLQSGWRCAAAAEYWNNHCGAKFRRQLTCDHYILGDGDIHHAHVVCGCARDYQLEEAKEKFHEVFFGPQAEEVVAEVHRDDHNDDMCRSSDATSGGYDCWTCPDEEQACEDGWESTTLEEHRCEPCWPSCHECCQYTCVPSPHEDETAVVVIAIVLIAVVCGGGIAGITVCVCCCIMQQSQQRVQSQQAQQTAMVPHQQPGMMPQAASMYGSPMYNAPGQPGVVGQQVPTPYAGQPGQPGVYNPAGPQVGVQVPAYGSPMPGYGQPQSYQPAAAAQGQVVQATVVQASVVPGPNET